MEIKGSTGSKLARILYLYFEFFDRIFNTSLRIQGSKDGIKVSLETSRKISAPIDERIKNIDIARDNLLEGLKAIDELKKSAAENKTELEVALEKLGKIEKEKQSAEEELREVKNIASSDIDAFRKIAGIPDKSEKRRDQFVGFFSGVIASLIASGIIFGWSSAWEYISTIMP